LNRGRKKRQQIVYTHTFEAQPPMHQFMGKNRAC
jgi:hypothetical protein